MLLNRDTWSKMTEGEVNKDSNPTTIIDTNKVVGPHHLHQNGALRHYVPLREIEQIKRNSY